MDKITFEWFFQLPGLFITAGIVLILIALIVFIISGKSSKKNDVSAVDTSTPEPATTNSSFMTPIGEPVGQPIVNNIGGQPVGISPSVSPVTPISPVQNNSPFEPVVAPVDPIVAPTTPVNNSSINTPTIEPITPVTPVVPEVKPVEEVKPVIEPIATPVVNPTPVVESTPIEPVITPITPVVPEVNEVKPIEEVAPTIEPVVASVNPMENSSVVPTTEPVITPVTPLENTTLEVNSAPEVSVAPVEPKVEQVVGTQEEPTVDHVEIGVPESTNAPTQDNIEEI